MLFCDGILRPTWHVSTDICVCVRERPMFDAQKVQRSLSDDFAQLVKAPETSGCH